MDIINPYIHGGEALTFDGFGNRSRSFNGVDDYVSIADNADIPTGAQTICCWVKFNTLNSGPSGQDLITHWTTTDSNNASFAIYMPNSGNGKVRFYVSEGGQLHVNVEAADAISALEWAHVVCVFTPNDSIKIYINGSLSNTLATTGISSLYDSSVDLVLGGRDQVSITTPLNGNLADVRIYDTDLTATDISDIYNGTNITTNLVGHWLTDADNVLDNAGSNNGTNYGSKYSYDNPSPPVEFGSASRSFDGLNDVVDLGNTNSRTIRQTVCAWVKPDAFDATYGNGYFSKWNGNLTNGREWMLWLSWTSPNRIEYRITQSNGTVIVCTSPTNVVLNEWVHVVGVADETNIYLYINGSLVDTTSYDGTNSVAGLSVSCIGSTNYPNTTAHNGSGKICDCRIYDTDLTASQVLDIYNGTNVTTNLIGHWLTDNDDIEDKAGTNDGTNYGSTYSYDNPPMDLVPSRQASRSFNGSSHYINTNASFNNIFNSSFTFACWAKCDDGQPPTTNVFFGNQNNIPVSRFLCGVTSNGSITSYYNSDGNVCISQTQSTLSNGNSQWFHVVFTVTPSGNNIYIDGSLQSLDATNNGDMSGVVMGDYDNSTANCFIGARSMNNSPDLHMDGNLADVRLYDTNLTTSQILDIYNGTTDRTNLIGQWLTNSDDVLDHAGTNDGTNYGSTYSTDSPS